VEYISLKKMPWYKECNPLVEGLGYILVELRVNKVGTQARVSVSITRKENLAEGIGVDDCAKVHRVLFPRLEVLMSSQEVYLEVMSPGMERNVKNAAEFAIFIDQSIRVLSRKLANWISGTLISADLESLVMELMDSSEKITIQYEDIAKAKLLNT
jgi:ribosome maturation factor RimP